MDQDVFTFADKVLAPGSRATEFRTPLQCVLEITKRCNLRCNHCYVGDARWNQDPEQSSTEEILRRIDILSGEGVLWLTITGGEPLAHRDFRRIWRHAFEKGFLLHLYTNATLFDEDVAGFLRRYPPGRIEVSFYGATPETYRRMTGGDWSRFLRGVKLVAASGVPWAAKTSLTVDTLPELPAMREMARELGAALHVNDHVYPSTGEGASSGRAPCAVRVDPERSAEELATGGACASKEPGRRKLFHCGAGETSFFVSSRGELQMCNLATQRKVPLQGSDDFRRAWDFFGEVRKIQLHPSSPCASCDLSDICQNCAAAAHLETGHEQSAVEHLCRKTHYQAHLSGRPHACSIDHFVYRGPKQC